jgi:triacylglycerol lipase
VRVLGAVARMALQLPGAVRRRGCTAVVDLAAVSPDTARDEARCPVVLVHGYGGTDACWSTVRPALAEAGFGHVVVLRYGSVTTHPGAVGAELARLALDAVDLSGAPGVHLVGHSLGGLLVRSAVETHGDLAASVVSAVTISTPHGGVPLARIAPGTCARLMDRRERPASALPPNSRWLAYYSDRDRVVPAESARLDDPGHRARNRLIPGCGHLTICHDPRLMRSLIPELVAAETDRAALRTLPVERPLALAA